MATRDAYATLINDCIRGDATLFDRADSVEAAWALVDPILDAWKNGSAAAFSELSGGKRRTDGGGGIDGRGRAALAAAVRDAVADVTFEVA